MVSDSLNINNAGIYKKKFQKYGSGVKALRWSSYQSSVNRYRELVSDIDFSNSSLLDVGCGFGGIIPYINAKSSNFDYTGIDLLDEFITESKKRYPDYEFIQGDWVTYLDESKKDFDYILCCGALNSKVKNVEEYRKQGILKMFKNSKKACLFNMAGHYPQPRNDSPKSTIYYADAFSILEYCFTLTDKLIFRHHYNKKDFTIILFH